jgi:2'-5' RNA ligase
MSDTPFATLIWLLPAQPSHTRLSSLIADLARRYDAPVFEPHLTLGRVSGPALPELRVPTGSITLKSIGTFSSQVFTKTLFVRFAPDRALQALRSSLKMRAEKYDPHLSLLYCKLAPAELNQLRRSISLRLDRIRFDRFAVVRCPDPTTTKEDVEAWKYLNTGPLSDL